MVKAKRQRGKKGSRKLNQHYNLPSRSGTNSLGLGTNQKDHSHTIALANPFSPEAVGAKVPDEGSTKSVAVTIRDTIQVATSAAGYADVRISPNLGTGTVCHAATSGSAGVTTWNAAVELTDTTAYKSAFSTYRIVSWGVRVYNQLAPTAQTGSIRIITLPEENNGGSYITNGGLHEEMGIYAASSDNIHWISKGHGKLSTEYVDFTLGETPAWDFVHIRYQGGPFSVANALMVEVVYHIEAQIELGSVTSTMASAAAPHKPHVMAAAAATLAKHGGSHEGTGFGSIISRFAKSALQGAVSHFLPGFFQSGQRTVPRYSTIMDVD